MTDLTHYRRNILPSQWRGPVFMQQRMAGTGMLHSSREFARQLLPGVASVHFHSG
jgi:hypothetical protein